MNSKPYLRPALFAALCVSVLCCLAGFDGCTKIDDQTVMKIDALTEELAQIRQILEQNKLQTDAGTLDGALTTQLETISKTLADNQAQIQELGQCVNEVAAIRRELEGMTQQRDTVKTELQEANVMIEQMQSELTQRTEQIAALEAEKEQLIGQLKPAVPENTEPSGSSGITKVGFPTLEGFKD